MDDPTGLSDRQLRKVWAVLKPFESHIERVALFGSRAMGNYRPNSDIDLVIYGAIDVGDTARLWTEFNESSLSLTVDVIGYRQLTHVALRDHIDRVAIPLPFISSSLDTQANAAAE